MFIVKNILRVYTALETIILRICIALVTIIKKNWDSILLMLSLLLGDIYKLFKTPYPNKKSWFLLHPIDQYTKKEVVQSVTWYVKDSAEGLIWIIFLWVWYIREKKRDKFWKWLILLFLIFRIVDLGCYWLNHRHAGDIYRLCYLTIVIYAGINTIKEYRKYKNKQT